MTLYPQVLFAATGKRRDEPVPYSFPLINPAFPPIIRDRRPGNQPREKYGRHKKMKHFARLTLLIFLLAMILPAAGSGEGRILTEELYRTEDHSSLRFIADPE